MKGRVIRKRRTGVEIVPAEPPDPEHKSLTFKDGLGWIGKGAVRVRSIGCAGPDGWKGAGVLCTDRTRGGEEANDPGKKDQTR